MLNVCFGVSEHTLDSLRIQGSLADNRSGSQDKKLNAFSCGRAAAGQMSQIRKEQEKVLFSIEILFLVLEVSKADPMVPLQRLRQQLKDALRSACGLVRIGSAGDEEGRRRGSSGHEEHEGNEGPIRKHERSSVPDV